MSIESLIVLVYIFEIVIRIIPYKLNNV